MDEIRHKIIECRAYEISKWREKHGIDGDPETDWLEAEAEFDRSGHRFVYGGDDEK